MSFRTFFGQATDGFSPHGFQERIARDGLPGVLEVPTAAGKTAAVVLGWLWRLLHADPAATPRRLIFALPQRSLVEQVAAKCVEWLANLGRADQVALHVVMGGAGRSQQQWRIDMDKPAIVVGTVDSLVSKALNRGYGIGRAIFPIDFALVTNDAQWVIDEIQLCPESTVTMRQVAAFARRFGTARPFGLTCMTATVLPEVLDTVDNPWVAGDVPMRVEPSDRVGALAKRLDAARTIRELPDARDGVKALAEAIRHLHRAGTLTLVVVNTVRTARDVFRALGGDDVLLLHSRFRGVERATFPDRLAGGGIVVATQVVEAGLDIDANILVTEVGPWPSVVQRAGRCNRTGDQLDAQMWWFEPAGPEPYEPEDVAASVAQLRAREAESLTGERLLACQVPVKPQLVSMIREPDFLDLFDTTPDLSGADVDIQPYVRDADDLDVQLCWAHWDSLQPNLRMPGVLWRCRAPLGEARKLLQKAKAWRWDQQRSTWARAGADSLRPGEVLLLRDTEGGYDPATGFDPAIRARVQPSPGLVARVRRAEGGEDGFGEDDPGAAPLTLDQHSQDAKTEAAALVAAVGAHISDGASEAVIAAAWLHDVGKAHPIWQEAALRHLSAQARQQWAQQVVAKSGFRAMLRFDGGVPFRHELVSLLLVDGPFRDVVEGLSVPDLARYLILAHHGKLRLQVRNPVDATLDWDRDSLLGLKEGALVVPALLGRQATQLHVRLCQFTLGHPQSWTHTALQLLGRYGPFVLAYLETLVRIADWRASQLHEPQESR